MKPLNIVMIASECVPYAKTGGLADVVGVLPRFFKKPGIASSWSCRVMHRLTHRFTACARSCLRWGCGWGTCRNGARCMSPRRVVFRFISSSSQKYFDRSGLYHDTGNNDYQDNPRRFGFLTRAGLQFCRDIGFTPDIVHVHDWHTTLATAYLTFWHWNDPTLGSAASVLTIHNVAYQGVYSAEHFPYLGLQWANFQPAKAGGSWSI